MIAHQPIIPITAAADVGRAAGFRALMKRWFTLDAEALAYAAVALSGLSGMPTPYFPPLGES